MPEVWISDRLGSQMGHAAAHQVCLAHLLRDTRYAIEAGDKLFAPGFKSLLKRAFVIARRRENLADSTLVAYRRELDRRLDRLLAIEPDAEAGRKLKRAIEKCRDKLFRLRHPPRRAAHQQYIGAPAAPFGHLPQSDQRLSLCLGGTGLRRDLLRDRDRHAAWPHSPRSHPHLPRGRFSARRELTPAKPGGGEQLRLR